MDECRTCRAPVIWSEHELTGNLAPIDAKPVEGGNVVLMVDEDATRYRVLSKNADGKLFGAQGNTHTNHFATCPDSKEHRR